MSLCCLKFCYNLVYILIAECEEGWEPYSDKCFKMFNEKKSWPDAEAACKESSAHLAKIESQGENDFLLNTFLQIPHDEVNREAWIGLTDVKKEGTFVWADGTDAEYTNWADEQPNNEDGEQHCGEIANGVFWPGGEPQVGVWNDFQCENELMYICKKNALS